MAHLVTKLWNLVFLVWITALATQSTASGSYSHLTTEITHIKVILTHLMPIEDNANMLRPNSLSFGLETPRTPVLTSNIDMDTPMSLINHFLGDQGKMLGDMHLNAKTRLLQARSCSWAAFSGDW